MDTTAGAAGEPPVAFPREPALLEGVPDWHGFLGVDELEGATDRQLQELPGLRAWTCGTDSDGRPVRCLEAGSAPRRMLLLGHVHGEEPAGTLLLEYLLPLFAATDLSERLGFSLAAIKVCDPQAARLNEAWIHAPYDVAAYSLHSYRSAYAEQPVWSFPVEYKGYRFDDPPPETRAMMAAVDSAPLDLIMSLHNCSFYGGYFYLSDADDELLREVEAVRAAAHIPSHRGEPELPYLTAMGDGVFEAVTVAQEMDYLERYGKLDLAEVSAGCDSDEYAMRRWGSHAVLAESPCFTSDQVADMSPAGMSRGEAKLAGIAREQEHVAWLHAALDEAGGTLPASPWRRAVEGYLLDCERDLPAEKEQARSDPAFAVEATVAQRFTSLYNRELLALCRIGQFARATDLVAARESHAFALRDQAEERVRARVAEITGPAGIRPVPVRRRVQMQLGALLAAMAYTAGRRCSHGR